MEEHSNRSFGCVPSASLCAANYFPLGYSIGYHLHLGAGLFLRKHNFLCALFNFVPPLCWRAKHSVLAMEGAVCVGGGGLGVKSNTPLSALIGAFCLHNTVPLADVLR